MGRAVLSNGLLQVEAPIDYVGPFLPDPSLSTGYVHSFLRPYQVAMRGRWKRAVGLSRSWNLQHVTYVLLDAAPLDGLRCAAAISLSKSKNGYTLVLFPSSPRRPVQEGEVDHLSAHITFSGGKILTNEIHAKIRRPGEDYPSSEAPLDHLARDDAHFAFEYWFKDIRYLDPPVQSQVL